MKIYDMKRGSNASLLALLILLFSFNNTNAQSNNIVNPIKIGAQTWMTKNLVVERFQNGDLIP